MGTVTAFADGGSDGNVLFASSPFVLTVNCTYTDNNSVAGSRHRFLVFLNNTTQKTPSTNDVYFDLDPNEGTFYYDLVGSIAANKYDVIAVHIYCGVTDFYTNNVDDADDDFVITLT